MAFEFLACSHKLRADSHCYRARLFFREPIYPFKSENGAPRTPADDLAAAKKLINACGYHRRDQELADAKATILGPLMNLPKP